MSPKTLRLPPSSVVQRLPWAIPRKNQNRNLATMAASSHQQTSTLTADLRLPSSGGAAAAGGSAEPAKEEAKEEEKEESDEDMGFGLFD